MNYKKLFTIVLCLGMLCACQNKQANTNTGTKQNDNVQITYDDNDYYIDYENDSYTKIDLDQEKDQVTVSKAGTYELKGSLNGSIVVAVNDDDTVRLVLRQAVIHAENGPAIRCESGKKLIISLYEGSENQISDSADTASDTTEADASIFVQNDLTINGSGSLSINANIQNAIKAKDTLKLMEGTLQVKSTDNGIIGKDAILIHEGSYQIEAQGDAIKSTYDKDDEKGDVLIENGTFELKAQQDGIQATRNLTIYNGDFQIETGGGSSNGVKAANAFQPGGFGRWNQPQDSSSDDTVSAKGIKAEGTLTISDGAFQLNTSDDSLHANGDVTLTNGSFSLSAGDDGVHSDQTLTVNGGNISVLESYEGLEGANIVINDGNISVVSSDDGINAAGGSDNDNESQRSPDQFMKGGDYSVKIHGGTILIDAKGDGLDSNGTIDMNGGSVVVFGPSDGGNGALDYETAFTISDGILIAVGSSQMAQAPSASSSQNAMMINLSQQDANTMFYLCDENDQPIIGAIPNRTYSNVVISTPKLTSQKTYHFYIGGSGNVNDAGYMENGMSGGTLFTTLTLTDTVTQYGQGGMGNPGGMGKDNGTNRQNGMGEHKMPPDENMPADRDHFPPDNESSQQAF